MPTGRAPTRQSPDASAGGRLHIHGIKEMPAGYDAEVAELFRDFRAASNLTESDLAARLSTRLEVVQALEQGALYALPPWAETCRVVNNYGLLLNLDVRPLLRRIYAQVEAGIVELRPKPMPEVPFMMPPEADAPDFPMGGRPPMAPRPAPYAQPPRPNVAPRPPGQVIIGRPPSATSATTNPSATGASATDATPADASATAAAATAPAPAPTPTPTHSTGGGGETSEAGSAEMGRHRPACLWNGVRPMDAAR